MQVDGAAASARKRWSDATPEDIERVARQLGRKPRSVVAIAARCRFGSPQVIVNHPAPTDRSGRRRPFPTLFWLTCPYLVQAVSSLEAAGWVDRFRRRLERDEAAREQMHLAHGAHARLRLVVCGPDALAELPVDEQQVLVESGIGGMRRVEGVKCLHAHLADYLGRGPGEDANWVGQVTAGMLLTAGIDLKGRSSCISCADCFGARSGIRESKVAAVDIGSNAVRMVVAERPEGCAQGGAGQENGYSTQWNVVERVRIPTRLGRSLRATHSAQAEVAEPGVTDLRAELDPQAALETIRAIGDMAERARRLGASVILAAATAAVRESQAAEAFLVEVWEKNGISVPVISGDQEAKLAFLGAVRSSHLDPSVSSVTVIDVGGGSTEIVQGSVDGEVLRARSFPLGAVRCTSAYGLALGGSKRAEALYADASAKLGEFVRPNEEAVTVIGVGGTVSAAAIVAAADGGEDVSHASLHGRVVSVEAIRRILARLAALPAEERVKIPGVEAERADIIVAGVAILLAAMDVLGSGRIRVSVGGVADGLLWQLN